MIDHREEVLQTFTRLTGGEDGAAKLSSLVIEQNKGRFEGWRMMELPEWAADLAPEGYKGLMVPLWHDGLGAEWDHYDWWRAAHFMMTSEWERTYEKKNGTVHSYSFHYDPDDQIIFDHAWVNRMILFLRRWWAVKNEADETRAFGAIPRPVVHLTHDVDAVYKTLPIRAKQAAFWTYNKSPIRAMKFFFTPGDYWQFDTIMQMENTYGYTSTWNMYGGKGGWLRSPKEILFDPSYSVAHDRLKRQLCHMRETGHIIGLHQSFDAWQDEQVMHREKQAIEAALGAEVTSCRQHWLRFSFDKTWKAQAKAGLKTDMTLGFNDRPGFRNAAAVDMIDRRSNMRILPMVLMDSQLYDYAGLDDQQREETMDHVLKELVETGGEASIIWHHRVFHPDYGWGEGYHRLLQKMKALGIEAA